MKTVLCHGVFDVLHPGHIDHLRQARAMGDRLIVSVTADSHVLKGPGRPVFSHAQRAVVLQALDMVDDVYICHDSSALPAIERYKPMVYAKGGEYRLADPPGNLERERAAVESYGGVVAFTDGAAMSSTGAVNRGMPRLADATMEWLRAFPHSTDEVLTWLEKMEPLSVGVVGESIVDEYVYVEPMGRSAKESLVTWHEVDREPFAGGVRAVAGHLSQLCGNVQIVSDWHDSITKVKHVERPWYHKVASFVPPKFQVAWFDSFDALREFDLVVVADYGHGLIPDCSVADRIKAAAKWVGLTVQANSLNWGMNTATKWLHEARKCHYIVVDEAELRLATQEAYTPVEDLAQLSVSSHRQPYLDVLAVTLGHRGCLIVGRHEACSAPALAVDVVDRMGAGDAFLAATAPLAYLGAPKDVIALVGNVAGALQVGRVGNSRPVEQRELRGWIISLLKS